MSVSRDSWFFIIGCQRSGTTLMRLVLECHSQIGCIDDPVSYGVMSGRASVHCRGCLVGLKVPCLTEQFGDATLWDPIFLPEMPNVYMRQPLIFMVRDVRDTVASMKTLRVGGAPWFESCLSPTLKAKRVRGGTFMERYGADIATLGEARSPVLARAALYWRYKVESLHRYLSCGFPTLLVRYEDLVADPSTELAKTCTFLRVPWEQGLLEHPHVAHRGLDRNGMAIGGTDPWRPIDTRSTGLWQTAFCEEEIEEILRFAGPVQASLYP